MYGYIDYIISSRQNHEVEGMCISVILNHILSLSGVYLKQATLHNSMSIAGHLDIVPILFSDFGLGLPKE